MKMRWGQGSCIGLDESSCDVKASDVTVSSLPRLALTRGGVRSAPLSQFLPPRDDSSS